MYFFIVNPGSCCGRGAKVWEKLKDALEKRAVGYEHYLTGQPGDARSIARMLSKNCSEPRVIVVVGGNGTLNEVLDGLALNDMVTLGYIPSGTGNDFAKKIIYMKPILLKKHHLIIPSIHDEHPAGSQ